MKFFSPPHFLLHSFGDGRKRKTDFPRFTHWIVDIGRINSITGSFHSILVTSTRIKIWDSSTNIYDCARNCYSIQITLVLGVLWQIGLILISNVTPRIKEEKYYTEFKYRIKRRGRREVKSFNQWIIFKKYFFQFLFLSLHFVNFRNIVRIFHLLTLKTFNELKMLFTLSLFAFFSIALDSSRNSFNSHEVYRETKKDLK